MSIHAFIYISVSHKEYFYKPAAAYKVLSGLFFVFFLFSTSVNLLNNKFNLHCKLMYVYSAKS